ncbi:YciI family protein [Caballeronia sp. SEWSISQ10-4 2]|uniref:YciI family protein n=1 Tax=Caballeronia sp. SEWSISQ10-4 2 TaxID=2937438 RepID=UPI00264F9A5E|nr:YciI family protein [Caballeronia sp. SEWSISQ10-4 2]MDN7183414.1 YciI family protein [Caballeronia sp. SEWSISQ10-4 2]
MRFIILVKATEKSEAGVLPEDALISAMATYHEELAKAGVLLDASGFQPSAKGWRVRYEGGRRTVIDGPFPETRELIAGYTLIQVRSREEAMEWARRFPSPMGERESGEIEVRQLYELDEIGSGESIERFRELEGARR